MLSAVSGIDYNASTRELAYILTFFIYIGAAGNFLVPISGMSENAFKTVMEIDTVGRLWQEIRFVMIFTFHLYL